MVSSSKSLISVMAFEIQPLNAIADLEEVTRLLSVTSNIQEPMKTILGEASPEDKQTLIFHSCRDWLMKPGAIGFKMVKTSTKYDSIVIQPGCTHLTTDEWSFYYSIKCI